jgi:hypothetical protein
MQHLAPVGDTIFDKPALHPRLPAPARKLAFRES